MAPSIRINHCFENGRCVRCGHAPMEAGESCPGFQYRKAQVDVGSWEDPTGMIEKVPEAPLPTNKIDLSDEQKLRQLFDSRGRPTNKIQIAPEADIHIFEKKEPESKVKVHHGMWYVGDQFTICGRTAILHDDKTYWTTDLPKVQCADCRSIIERNQKRELKELGEAVHESINRAWASRDQGGWCLPDAEAKKLQEEIRKAWGEFAKFDAAVTLLKLVAEHGLEHDELSMAARDFLLRQFKGE